MPSGTIIRAQDKGRRFWDTRFPEMSDRQKELNVDRNLLYAGLGLRADAMIAGALSTAGMGSLYSIIFRRAAMKLYRAVEKRSGNKMAYDLQAVQVKKDLLEGLKPAPSGAGTAFDTVAAKVFEQGLVAFVNEV